MQNLNFDFNNLNFDIENITIGVTGHRKIKAEGLNTIKDIVEQKLKNIQAEYNQKSVLKNTKSINFAIASCLSEGTDRFVAKIGLEQKMELHVFLPFTWESELHGYDLAEQEKEQSKKELMEFKNKCQSCFIFGQKEEKEHDKDNKNEDERKEIRHKIYLEAGLAMLKKSDIIIALWNGEEQKDQGSTYDIIQRAILQNKPVYWVKVEKE